MRTTFYTSDETVEEDIQVIIAALMVLGIKGSRSQAIRHALAYTANHYVPRDARRGEHGGRSDGKD
jgi:hypothetical protein